MQTVTNMYILNLAIADECFLIGIPFLITTMQLGEFWSHKKHIKPLDYTLKFKLNIILNT